MQKQYWMQEQPQATNLCALGEVPGKSPWKADPLTNSICSLPGSALFQQPPAIPLLIPEPAETLYCATYLIR